MMGTRDGPHERETLVGLLNISCQLLIKAPDELRIIRGREC